MENRRSLARIIDDVVVDVIVVDDVRDIATTCSLSFDTLLSWIQI